MIDIDSIVAKRNVIILKKIIIFFRGSLFFVK